MKRIFSVLLTVCLVMGLTACGAKEERWQEQYDLGIKYLSEGNYEEAILAFNAAIEIDPKAVDSYWGRAEAYAKDGDELSAWKDVKQILDLTEDITQIQDKLDGLGEIFEDPDIFDSLVQKYVEENKPSAEPDDPEPTTGPDERLDELLETYAENTVTHEKFLTCSGIDIAPYPEEAKGFISGTKLDLDGDGAEELITAWSDGNKINLKLYDNRPDGTLQEIDFDGIVTLSYSNNIQIALYYRPTTDQWLIAVGEFTYQSYTGYKGFICKLYQLQPEGLTLLNTWEENNVIQSFPENLNSELEAVQWPIQDNSFIRDLNTEKPDSLTYLVKMDVFTDPGEDGLAYTDDIHYQRFLSPEELAEFQQESIEHNLPVDLMAYMGTDLDEFAHIKGDMTEDVMYGDKRSFATFDRSVVAAAYPDSNIIGAIFLNKTSDYSLADIYCGMPITDAEAALKQNGAVFKETEIIREGEYGWTTYILYNGGKLEFLTSNDAKISSVHVFMEGITF